MSDPLVHVLVINWNGMEHLQECFETLLANRYANVRFVLLDNGSTDGSADYVRGQFASDPRLEIVEFEKNLGWSGCNNAGMERAMEQGADFVLLLNNDTASAPDLIERLVDCSKERPDAGALAPKMLLYNHPELLNSLGIECSIIGNGWDLGIGRLDGPNWDTPAQVLGVCGGACWLRVDALRKVGLLPADYGIYLDDLELSMRLWNGGFEIWTCPSAAVRHKFSATMGQGRRAREKYYLSTRNRLRLIQRNFPLSKTPQFLPYLIWGECKALGRAALDREFWRVAAHLKAWAAAIAYTPMAIAARRTFRRRGLRTGAFWHMICPRPLFFPGPELPDNGWYPPRLVNGEWVQPISAKATLQIEGGVLRCSVVNCYPDRGEVTLTVSLDGRQVAKIQCPEREKLELELDAGTLDIVAGRIFDAAETGGRADYGGWIAWESAPPEKDAD